MENFVVSARKYRPDSFTSVVGQQSITTTLKNSIKNKHLGHAYLFSGPRGVGKTTCARIFAKTINCFNLTEEGEACNHCESCNSFNENRSYNIHELDAASNNSVDDIRTLTDQVRIPPQVGSYSIYIIDEVHMLSQQAFNAFLKTLEEPPRHAMFILATTEKHKIIPTILSRCQVYDFNRISVEDAVAYLKDIAGKEGVKYEEDALQIIAKKADGAMRDALSIFDQVVSFSGNHITYRSVIDNLNILDYDYFFKLTEASRNNDISSCLMLFDEILKKGFDARNFVNGFADHLRDLMVCKDPQTVQLLEVGAGMRERYLAQTEKVSLDFLITGLELCNQADIQFKSSKNQRLTIELTLVKLANLSGEQKKKVTPPDEQEKPASVTIEENVIKPAPAQKNVEPDDQKPSQSRQSHENGVVRKSSISIKNSLRGERQVVEDVKDVSFSDETGFELAKDPASFPNPEELLASWNRYAESMENIHPRIYSTLKSHQPEISSDGKMNIILNSQAQKDNFTKNIKPNLIAHFEKEFGKLDYLIEAVLEANNKEGKKIYTDQDKFDYLLTKNPDLGKLKTLFNLDFDD